MFHLGALASFSLSGRQKARGERWARCLRCWVHHHIIAFRKYTLHRHNNLGDNLTLSMGPISYNHREHLIIHFHAALKTTHRRAHLICSGRLSDCFANFPVRYLSAWYSYKYHYDINNNTSWSIDKNVLKTHKISYRASPSVFGALKSHSTQDLE